MMARHASRRVHTVCRQPHSKMCADRADGVQTSQHNQNQKRHIVTAALSTATYRMRKEKARQTAGFFTQAIRQSLLTTHAGSSGCLLPPDGLRTRHAPPSRHRVPGRHRRRSWRGWSGT